MSFFMGQDLKQAEEKEMSQENAKIFMELLNRDEELQIKVKAAAESYTGDKTDEKALFEAVILPIAKEAGYEFSYEDAEELAKAAQDDELSEEDVAVAAGGIRGNGCFVIGFTMDDENWELVDETIVGGSGCIYVGAAACRAIGVGFSW